MVVTIKFSFKNNTQINMIVANKFLIARSIQFRYKLLKVLKKFLLSKLNLKNLLKSEWNKTQYNVERKQTIVARNIQFYYIVLPKENKFFQKITHK